MTTVQEAPPRVFRLKPGPATVRPSVCPSHRSNAATNRVHLAQSSTDDDVDDDDDTASMHRGRFAQEHCGRSPEISTFGLDGVQHPATKVRHV